MNIGRGLFRAWLLVSILWIIGAGLTAYTIVAPATLHGRFQPTLIMKKETTAEQVNKIDFGKPFYDFGVSPTQLNSTIEFSIDQINPTGLSQYIDVEFPDGSRLDIPAGYSEADKNYISKQFWDQRWSRWAGTVGPIAVWAFVPCIVLFIFGYCLLWVGRGFKRA
jgi:hypothetical protein